MVDIKKEISKIRELPNDFFNPNDSNYCDTNLLLNIKEASNVFLKYINSDKKITIVIDPDIDGIMATSIMYLWVKEYGHNNITICHHQRSMGHGVIPNRIKPTSLLIIVDSSSNSIQEIEEIINKKIAEDVIIIDHHITDGNINKIKNTILINPHQPDDKYNNKCISGAMLTYKFVQHIERNILNNNFNYTDKIGDLAAISIISDVMDVSNMENRLYYYKGMENVYNLGLASLLDKLRVKPYKISSVDEAFKLNKALNSTLRLQDILLIFKLILLYNSDEQDYLIEKIMNNIKSRETLEIELMDNLKELYKCDEILIMENTLSNEKPMTNNFSGVVASKLVDKYKCSVIIVDSKLKGSARAYNSFEFNSYVNKSEYASAIGHEGAFGIKIKDLEKFIQYIKDHPPVYIIEKDYEIELSLKDLSKKIFEEIKNIQYLTGNGFKEIKFKINNIKIDEIKKTSGGTEYYINSKKSYIRFLNKSIIKDNINIGNTINVYCTLNINNFFGTDYYECSCENIEIIDTSINDEWGF